VLSSLKASLDSLYSLVDATPPVQQSLRYGNPAFRTWFNSMSTQATDMMTQVGEGGEGDVEAAVCCGVILQGFGKAGRKGRGASKRGRVEWSGLSRNAAAFGGGHLC